MDFFETIPKKKRTDASITKEFLDWYYERYKVLFGVPPLIHFGKDNKLVAIILKTYKDLALFGCSEKLEFLVKACEKYFISKDAFALKNAWNIHAFYCNIPKIVLLLKDKETAVSPIIEGFKLAYFNFSGNKYDEALLIDKEESFSQIYLFLKSLWVNYGAEFTLLRFSEIFFLIMFDHLKNKEYGLNFFYTKYTQDFFTNWLISEGKSILMFIPKGVGTMDKDRLQIEQDNLIQEEMQLLENYK